MDSSIWIAYFRDPEARVGIHLQRLVDAGEAFVAGPVLYEVLQGTRSPREFEVAFAHLQGLPYLIVNGTTWVSAAGMAAGLLRRGVTLPMTDVLLATLARENGCQVWSADAHFQQIPGARLYRPPDPRIR